MPPIEFTQLDYKNRAFLQKFVEAGAVYTLTVDHDGVIVLTPEVQPNANKEDI